jgi:hypothetical protein
MLKQCTLTNYITGKIFLFKGSPSREGHETDFSVLTTIELCLPVEFTKPWKQRTVYIKFNRFFNDKKHELRAKIQAKIYKLPLMCYELQDMKYETQTMSYKLRNTRRDKRHGRETGPSYDSTYRKNPPRTVYWVNFVSRFVISVLQYTVAIP